jgi:putative ABC transport system ATP-binding protein
VPDSRLSVEHVSLAYGSRNVRVQAVNDVSLEFAPGTLTLVMGPSGSGKTTLLSVLGCLLRPDAGRVMVNGVEAGGLKERERTEMRRREIGFIFQAFRLFRSLTAFENVMMAAEISGKRDAAHGARAHQLLQELGLGDKTESRPAALSGGEKQRVAIGRALLLNPPILLADEPTASLDSVSGRQICGILRGLADTGRHTLVVVSHDLRWKEFAHRTVVLQDGRTVEDQAAPRAT